MFPVVVTPSPEHHPMPSLPLDNAAADLLFPDRIHIFQMHWMEPASRWIAPVVYFLHWESEEH